MIRSSGPAAIAWLRSDSDSRPDRAPAPRTLPHVASRRVRKARAAIAAIPNTVRHVLDRDVIVAHWWNRVYNLGDALNPVLLHALSGRAVIHAGSVLSPAKRSVICAIGSVLQNVDEPQLTVWGSGFISDDAKLRRRPAAIKAVRGPLTRTLLVKQGVPCPEIYGDPALLCSEVFPVASADRVATVLVPHYRDFAHPAVRKLADQGASAVVDVTGPVEDAVYSIARARVVISSSLHGLIIAVSYGVPAVWVTFSNDVLGGGFKFRDFFESIGVPRLQPLPGSATLSALVGSARVFTPDLDLAALRRACPVLPL